MGSRLKLQIVPGKLSQRRPIADDQDLSPGRDSYFMTPWADHRAAPFLHNTWSIHVHWVDFRWGVIPLLVWGRGLKFPKLKGAGPGQVEFYFYCTIPPPQKKKKCQHPMHPMYDLKHAMWSNCAGLDGFHLGNSIKMFFSSAD
jgi:hypothetical protein